VLAAPRSLSDRQNSRCRRIWVEKAGCPFGVYAKDLILHMIRQLGVKRWRGLCLMNLLVRPSKPSFEMEDAMKTSATWR